MIADQKTNLLYLADTLRINYFDFWTRFEKTLAESSIKFDWIPITKDIWARDYMPIQVNKDKFVQFVYNPSYLRDDVKWKKTISDVDAICNAIGVTPLKTDIVVDGGNVVKSEGRVIMCDRVFSENPHYTKPQLMDELQRLFETDQLIFIPTHEGDEFGHADGMVRFLDNNTVLVNDYSGETSEFQGRFLLSLHKAGLDWIEIPYNPYNNKLKIQAQGIYINYLEIGSHVILPAFGMKEDDIVSKQFEELFRGKTVSTVNSNEIANEGGVLNCITWDVYNY